MAMAKGDQDRTEKGHNFPPGQEPRVLTSVSDQCTLRECEKCSGIFQREDYPGESIFCTHDCHLVRNTDQR
jgi:hypothetical protein